MECRHIHHGFHGQVHMDSMEQVHVDSMEWSIWMTTILIVIVSLPYLSKKAFYNIRELNPRPKQGEQCSN